MCFWSPVNAENSNAVNFKPHCPVRVHLVCDVHDSLPPSAICSKKSEFSFLQDHTWLKRMKVFLENALSNADFTDELNLNLSTCRVSNKDVFVQLFVVHFQLLKMEHIITSLEAFSHLVLFPHSLAQGCHLFPEKCSCIWWKVEVCVLVPLETLWKISSGIDFWEEHSTETASGSDPNSWLRFPSIIFSSSTM